MSNGCSNDLHDLPFLCAPNDIYLYFFKKKLGLNAIYDFFHEESFPKVVIGRKFFVTKPAFLDWWERQEQGKEAS